MNMKKQQWYALKYLSAWFLSRNPEATKPFAPQEVWKVEKVPKECRETVFNRPWFKGGVMQLKRVAYQLVEKVKG